MCQVFSTKASVLSPINDFKFSNNIVVPQKINLRISMSNITATDI